MNAAFDINEYRGKESGRAQADGSQYKNKEHIIRLGGAAAKSFFWQLSEKLAQLNCTWLCARLSHLSDV